MSWGKLFKNTHKMYKTLEKSIIPVIFENFKYTFLLSFPFPLVLYICYEREATVISFCFDLCEGAGTLRSYEKLHEQTQIEITKEMKNILNF